VKYGENARDPQTFLCVAAAAGVVDASIRQRLGRCDCHSVTLLARPTPDNKRVLRRRMLALSASTVRHSAHWLWGREWWAWLEDLSDGTRVWYA